LGAVCAAGDRLDANATDFIADVEQVGRDIEDADDLVDLLNLMNERRQA
jgi:hypothetical protein